MARSVHFNLSELNGPFTEGSASFDPDKFLDPDDPMSGIAAARPFLEQNDFRQAILAAFQLPQGDKYTYHAVASVNLDQVQSAVNAGSANGLHSWYFSADGTLISNPPVADIDGYISIFEPGRVASSALASFVSNAKKDSLRKAIGQYLQEKRYVDGPFSSSKKGKKLAVVPSNPALDFWAWTCRALQWAGPTAETAKVRMAHHLLPVMMHHFGCVTPTEEAVQLLTKAAESSGSKREIVEIGSGNGYWTMLLRKRGLSVTPVDNQQSIYRTLWIDDTIREDGIRWLKKKSGAKDKVLLLVYPITAGGWTAEILRAYRGDDICIVGTQNDNHYTSFSNETIEAWMAREKRSFEKAVQIPLPSFAGKDEALYIFRRTKS
jgi:hypothetical protein